MPDYPDGRLRPATPRGRRAGAGPPSSPDEIRRGISAGHTPKRCPGRARFAAGSSLLGALLRDPREQSTDFGLPVTPVPPERAD